MGEYAEGDRRSARHHSHYPSISCFTVVSMNGQFFSCFFFSQISFPASGQAVVGGVVPSSPWFLPSFFIAHGVQQSHYDCLSIFHRVLLTHALLALSASQFAHKKKYPRISTSMHSGGFKLTTLTYTRLVDNLIRHRGDRQISQTDLV